MPAAAYPFIDVRIDTSALMPVAERSPGVVAIVGSTGGAGTAEANRPFEVSDPSEAAALFASTDAAGAVVPTTLYDSLKVAFLQDPRPSKIYGVKIADSNFAAGLAALEAADDVTFVSLANDTDVGAAASTTGPATNLLALKDHVETMSAAGQKRIGVAMVDPTIGKSTGYVDTVKTAIASLKSDVSRMVMIAARGATSDAATAAMAAMAGFEPHISIVLKRVRGVTMPLAGQYSPSEIKQLSEANIDPIIDPALIVGDGLHFAEGRTFTTDESLLYVDVVRTLDDIEFRVKAGLIGLIGDARITKSGLLSVRTAIDGILGVQLRRGVIDAYAIDIPTLAILSLPESAWTATDRNVVVTARANRTVDVVLSITYGPAIHRLRITLAPKF
jgi:hypothetical protein